MYQSLDIYLALVGVEVWTEGDLINTTSDPMTTLSQFTDYRTQHINTRHPNDNAILIS